jgi:putative peptidoglycan lipid II flippase
VLSRRVGGLRTRTLARFLARLALAVAASTGIAAAVALLVPGLDSPHGVIGSLLQCAVIGGLDLVVLLVLARAMQIEEITEVVGTLTRRFRR